jgi:coenzyme F420-0:L-glutamate ligase/coenzyme F420-1:gamma-L-glutamate ligase
LAQSAARVSLRTFESAKMPITETLVNPFPASVQIVPLTGLPEVAPGDNLSQLLAEAVARHKLVPAPGDVIVLAQKIVSKSEGKIVNLDTITPSEKAREWANKYNKDPRLIEIVFQEASRIVRMERGVIIAETRHGFVCANAGVDLSNTPTGTALLLPDNPDRSASEIQKELARRWGAPVAVIISDTFGRPWREGLVNVALGVAGLLALADYRGQLDAEGKALQATVIAVADELAAASGLVMGKLNRVPAVVIRGVALPQGAGTARDLIRTADRDLFR